MPNSELLNGLQTRNDTQGENICGWRPETGVDSTSKNKIEALQRVVLGNSNFEEEKRRWICTEYWHM